MSKAQCALCEVVISSDAGIMDRCECGAIAVDDGRYLAIDFDHLIKLEE